MLRWILALLLIPFLDAVLLAVVVSQTTYIGWIGMVALVVLTGLVGMLLVRAEGRRTLRKTQRSLADGKPPTNQLLDGALLIAAGAFLLTPGLVTDLIGFMLVIPITRIPIRGALKRFVIVPYLDKKSDGFASGVVWSGGFPGEGSTGISWSSRSGADRRTGTGTETGSDPRDDDATTVDLDEDAYSVDTGSSGRRIGFDDESDGRSDRDDPSAR